MPTHQRTMADVFDAVTTRGKPVRFEPGEVLFHQGSTGRSCYAITSGEAMVTTVSSQGAVVVLNRCGPGALIGELAAIEGFPRSATVTARNVVEAMVLDPDSFVTLLLDEPALSLALLGNLADRIRALSDRYTLRTEELRVRVCDMLVTHYEQSGRAELQSTREELAGWVGATREAVVRTLRQLQDEGLVTTARGSVTVRDLDGLRRAGHTS